jgi:hypothetical protein
MRHVQAVRFANARAATPRLQILCGYEEDEIHDEMARGRPGSAVVSLYYMLLEQSQRKRSGPGDAQKAATQVLMDYLPVFVLVADDTVT